MHDQHDQHERHVRTVVPKDWSVRLAHLAADLGLPKHELVREAVLLLLRYHGEGQGLPEPLAPTTTEGEEGR